MEFDDEDENRVILFVYDMKLLFLDGRVVYIKQLELVMLVKDLILDMVIIVKKGFVFVCEICEKQS